MDHNYASSPIFFSFYYYHPIQHYHSNHINQYIILLFITQLFASAGMYPPGFQSSAALINNNLDGKGIGVTGLSALIAGLLVW